MSSAKGTSVKILLVDDDPAVALLFSDALELKGYWVWHARTGAEAVALLERAEPDLILLDLILPDTDGLVLCAELQARVEVPIIIVSATRRKRDAVLGLKLGADDFIAKPLDLNELEARVEAVLRRTLQQKAMAPVPSPNHLRAGGLVIDHVLRRVTLGGQVLHLTPTEYQLIFTLASRPNQVVSHQDLAQRVWGHHDSGTSRVLAVHIRRLRAKLQAGRAPAPSIVTMRGFGYRIVAESRRVAGSAA